MPAERTSVRTIKAVLQLKFEAHLSQRKIARSLNIGLGTVSLHLKRASKAGVSWPLPADLDDAALERLLFPSLTTPTRRCLAEPHHASLTHELNRKSATQSYL